jgi:hypothetical protein
MLKAIEWRTVFGALLVISGPLSALLLNGIATNVMGSGFIITALLVFSVAIIFKASGVPIRATLMLLSLPVGFAVSLVFAFSGSENTLFFQSSISAALSGGILFLLAYQKGFVFNYDPVPTSSIVISVIIISLGPLFLITFFQNQARPLLELYDSPSSLMVALVIGGLLMLQNKGEDSLAKYQFSACYGAILVAGLSVFFSFWLYDIGLVQEEWYAITNPDFFELYSETQLLILLSLLYSMLFYAVIVLISIAKNKTEDIMLKNWHLSEAYIFLTFMIIAPQSIYETIAGAAA